MPSNEDTKSNQITPQQAFFLAQSTKYVFRQTLLDYENVIQGQYKVNNCVDSNFHFSKTGCLIKAKEPCQSLKLTHSLTNKK